MQNSVPAILVALAATASFAQPASSAADLEAEIARLKTETAALVAAAHTALDALSPEQRLAAPPAIWRSSGARVQGLRRLPDDGRGPGRRVHHGGAGG
jgi:hypothetical protein